MSFITKQNEQKQYTGSGKLFKYILPKNKAVHIIPLICPFELTEDNQLIRYQFKTHFRKGEAAYLCDKSYSDGQYCAECEKTSSFGGQNFPTTTLTFPAYVLDLKGETYTSKSGSTGPENPEKLIEIPSGKKQLNWDLFQETFYEDEFMSTIWKIKKTDGGLSIQKADIKKLGNQLDLDVPQEVLDKYNGLTRGQKLGICLSVYQNVKWDHPDLIADGIVSPYESSKSEDSDQFSSDSEGDALD